MSRKKNQFIPPAGKRVRFFSNPFVFTVLPVVLVVLGFIGLVFPFKGLFEKEVLSNDTQRIRLIERRNRKLSNNLGTIKENLVYLEGKLDTLKEKKERINSYGVITSGRGVSSGRDTENVQAKPGISRLSEALYMTDSVLSLFHSVAEEREELLNTLPCIRPVRNDALITADFGMIKVPLYNTERFHYGVDYSLDKGSPVIAPADGRVEKAFSSSKWGKRVVIKHNAHFSTVYAHLESILTDKGRYVSRGDTIAEVGSTGLSSGPHLHYEVRVNGKRVNPEKYILSNYSVGNTSVGEGLKKEI